MLPIRALFPAARQRIADGREPMYAFIRYEPAPGGGPFDRRRRKLTFAELRAAYAEVVENARRIDDGQRYRRLRSQIIADTPACRDLISRIRDLETLPWGERMADHAAPLQAELEAIIAGRVAEARAEQMECAA